MVVHTFNPSAWEEEAGGSLGSRTAWSRVVSTRIARATQGDPDFKKHQKRKKKEKKKGSRNTREPGSCFYQSTQLCHIYVQSRRGITKREMGFSLGSFAHTEGSGVCWVNIAQV